MIKYHLTHNLAILFVGINPHPGSDHRGVPFSNNKMFWYLLSAAGLIAESRTDLRDDTKLKELYKRRFGFHYELGLINLIDRPTPSTASLTKNDPIMGRARLLDAIHTYRPRVVCFVGKITYLLFKEVSSCSYGWQEKIGASRIYVMHTPLRGAASVRIEELHDMARAAGHLSK
jgi:TDG/mug DNA glycosylase family protein